MLVYVYGQKWFASLSWIFTAKKSRVDSFSGFDLASNWRCGKHNQSAQQHRTADDFQESGWSVTCCAAKITVQKFNENVRHIGFVKCPKKKNLSMRFCVGFFFPGTFSHQWAGTDPDSMELTFLTSHRCSACHRVICGGTSSRHAMPIETQKISQKLGMAMGSPFVGQCGTWIFVVSLQTWKNWYLKARYRQRSWDEAQPFLKKFVCLEACFRSHQNATSFLANQTRRFRGFLCRISP